MYVDPPTVITAAVPSIKSRTLAVAPGCVNINKPNKHRLEKGRSSSVAVNTTHGPTHNCAVFEFKKIFRRDEQ